MGKTELDKLKDRVERNHAHDAHVEKAQESLAKAVSLFEKCDDELRALEARASEQEQKQQQETRDDDATNAVMIESLAQAVSGLLKNNPNVDNAQRVLIQNLID